jgi:HlyD family secretion protein
MTKSRKTALLGAGAIVLAGALVYGFSALRGASADVDESRIVAVERGTMVRSVVATGKIEPIAKVEIKSKANGIIKAIHVDVDRLVREGDILVELDRENIAARVRELRATLQGARAALEAAGAQLEKSRIEAEGPEVEFARRAYDRARSLFEQRLLAQSSLDETRNALEQAQNRQRAAQSQLSIAKAGVAQASANVAQSQAGLERAEEELANVTIRAPIAGTILRRDVEIGSPVSSILNMGAAATPVMAIGDISQVFVRGRVDEADIGRVRLGQAARITVETFKDRTFQGKVTEIAPMGVEKENVTNFEVKVSIENPGKELKANMTANAEIVLEEHPDSLIIPETAVSYDAQRNAFADVLDPGARTGRRRVPIKVGVGNGTRTQVLQGLKQGDKVVLPG